MTRLRRRNGTMEYLQEQPHVCLQPALHKGRWQQFFQQEQPIHVELGMGKGQFICSMARKYPQINFIGIDMYDELIRKASEKATGIDDPNKAANSTPPPTNLALLLCNIEKLDDIFAAAEISRIYLNFSDPWPKKRHEKRRLTHPDFIQKYLKLLSRPGALQLRTDSVSLFEYSLNVFAGMELKMRNIKLDLHRQGTPVNHVFTEYEEKFAAEGIPIQQVVVVVEVEVANADRSRN